MEATILFRCQYEENYGIHNDPPTEHWKKKGGMEFEVKGNADDIMFQQDEIVEWFKSEYLREWNNEFTRVTYVSHEVDWGDSRDISSEWKKFKANYKGNVQSLTS